jgi:drug/metabolite transporter (DMT)-like permease
MERKRSDKFDTVESGVPCMTKMKMVALLAFFLNVLCFATYYAVAKEALNRIDPIIFTYFEMMTLVPVAIIIIICSWKHITAAIVKRGMLLGSSLCLALFTIAIALKYTTATSVAFYPALNGLLAAVFAWFFLRQPMRKSTWFAGVLSVVGVGLLVFNSSMGGWRGSLIAFLGGLFFTVYVFLSDSPGEFSESKHAHWPLFGIELLTMALWGNLVVLLFGDWHAVHPSLPKDIWVVLYVAGVCTFVPTLIAAAMQRFITPVTVSFIYILEPVLGAFIAAYYLHEMLPLAGYIGGLLLVLGALVHTCGTALAAHHDVNEEVYIQEVEDDDDIEMVLFARSHRSMKNVPYTLARRGEKQLLQQRRRQRVLRLGILD